ncbi:hypothetical protein AcW1_005171 [Taiwanofungus camphoratus]|nr:hypothetical protein AcW1_005171 [Antrodia cinnamomea]
MGGIVSHGSIVDRGRRALPDPKHLLPDLSALPTLLQDNRSPRAPPRVLAQPHLVRLRTHREARALSVVAVVEEGRGAEWRSERERVELARRGLGSRGWGAR